MRKKNLENKDFRPVSRPFVTVPAPDSDNFNERFNEAERVFYEKLEQDKKNFEKALPRIRLCAFLNGFKMFFRGKTSEDGFTHYSWCPEEEWNTTEFPLAYELTRAQRNIREKDSEK